jgi:ketosteroid isomerase-like protein
MSESDNTAVVHRVIDAFYRNDIDAIVDACAEDVTFYIPGPDVIPFAGHFKGRDAVREYFDMIPETFDTITAEIHDIVAQGNKVVVNGHEVGVVKSTGKRFDNHWVMVWTIHDGVITDLFEYHDTAAIAEAFTP